MDFGTLLHAAQKNEKSGKKEGVRFYSTKFEPPKKEQRNKQQLSANIKKFLAKKEAEEREKKMEAHKKREELMALRAKDKKATRRVNVMLKRTKSANQSVLQDAADATDTSVTLAGPIQPDEDDYGYVSQEAAAFYNKMMEKYSRMPEEPKFSLNKKKKAVSTDLNGTKERVKAALEREREEATTPHRRKRRPKEEEEAVAEPEAAMTPPAKSKPKVAAPPPLNFNDLLKLAEKKQFEPIVIEQKPKEEERLFTKKQKKEMEREKEWRERKEGKIPPLENKMPKIARVNENASVNVNNKKEVKKQLNDKKIAEIKKVVNNRENVPSSQQVATKTAPSSSKNGSFNSNKTPLQDVKKKDLMVKKMQQTGLRQDSVKNMKPKQFPPTDLRKKELSFVRTNSAKEFPPKDVRRKQMPIKRRILDDDEDYDSEMDDFIDDGPEEGEDYSKYISEIFGYDKSKYRNIDDDVDNMESTFAQQMKEEVISTKIGIMEDLEDMKKEEEEKRRKALMKKRRL